MHPSKTGRHWFYSIQKPSLLAAAAERELFYCVRGGVKLSNNKRCQLQPPHKDPSVGRPIQRLGSPTPNTTSNRRIQQSQAQVDEVVDVMRMNMEKVMERDTKLSELDDRADALQAGASQFETSAAKLKRKNWWKNCKMMIILGGVCAIILIIIIIYFCT
ncbi:vesicle-associated membrane protein 2-like [Acipenser oxyrinchus oxyrinchus]|uniref:Vesicle-associated membrane protein 2-like n=1 Tax=Acipenser oxyrinchus oxyrinchus TaxID=40147 RepID=A0AAD8G841_ACIOX|nr:vesicle-associated membrane protein 2-like [Acipenser oxyrinchus oxyrinchus]